MESSARVSSLPVLPQYEGVVVVPRARDYLVAGEKFPRVTTALGIINKPALVPWAKKVALAKVSAVLLDPEVQRELVVTMEESPADYGEFVQRVIDRASKAPDEARDESAGKGTATHLVIKDALQGGWLDPMNKAAHAALAFLEEYEIEVVDAERVVWSPTCRVAGTVDGIGWRGERLVIWDWKTGGAIYWETALQLAAYAHLLEELTGVRVTVAYAVRLPRGEESEYEVKSLGSEGLDLAWDAYLAASNLHQAGKTTWWEVGDGV